MSLATADDGHAIHYPSDPKKFQFDGEVSAIFPDMARRAIPNFYEAHAAHAKMLQMWMRPGVRVLDIGASRGAFMQALTEEYPWLMDGGNPARLDAIDVSESMCSYLSSEMPFLNVRNQGILDIPHEEYDVVCMHYVLQFIEPAKQVAALNKAIRMVRPGGVFVYGHKASHSSLVGQIMHDRYIDFRVANGYSREEIAAKTQALKGSMSTVDDDYIRSTLQKRFTEVEMTFKFMMFGTYFAVK